jgi:hypothetical protein
MSEARDYFDEYGGARSNVARLRFAPNDTLKTHLLDFYNQPSQETLGRSGLFLYSEYGLRYFEEPQRMVDYGYTTDPVGLQAVDELQNSLKHRMNGQRKLDGRVEFKRLPDDDPGMLLRLGVVIDELTSRALQNTVFLEDDRTVRIGLKIPRHRLDHGTRLLAARDRLVSALELSYPTLAVSSLELVTRQQRL